MPKPKKGVADFIAKKVAKGAGKRLEKSVTKTINKSIKKDASKTLKKAGKAGSPLTSKITVGPKTRKKMAKGKFGSKVKQGPAAKQTQNNSSNVKKVDAKLRNPFNITDDTINVGKAKKAAEARRKSPRPGKKKSLVGRDVDEFFAVK